MSVSAHTEVAPSVERAAELRAAYRRCRRMQCKHDPTFYLATARLPRARRPPVHALYGFLRGADEIVDGHGRRDTPDVRRAALDAWHDALHGEIENVPTRTGHPVLAALADAGPRHGLPLHLLDRYVASMRVDCDDAVRIPDRAALDHYMDGSAATVGRLMAPLLGVGPEGAEPLARLGVAFQLTNFVRDVREDWEMGRVYLPDLDEDALARGEASPALRERIADEVARARAHFAAGREVEPLLHGSLRGGVRLARAVYVRVLDRVERLGYDVVTRRAALPPWETARALGSALR